MKNKKLSTLLFCAVMSMSVAVACSDNGDNSSNDSTPPASDVTTTTYTVTFAGADISAQTIDENGKVAKPNDPVKTHYTFNGWYNGETLWDFETDTVTSNLTLTAKFTAIEYTITFKADGEQVGEPVTYTVEDDTIVEPNVPLKEGYGGKWEPYTLDGGNKEVNAVYTPIEYTITFKADGEQVGEAVKYTVESETISEPDVPAKDYYTGVWETYTLDGGDKTVNVVYTPIEYTLKFIDFNGQETTATYNVENKDEFALPALPAAPEHYENARWNKTLEDCLVFSKETIVVEAIADAKTYMVAFNTMGASGMEAVGVKYNETLVLSNVPKLDGYVFKGWTLNGEAYDMNTPVTEDIILVATWYKETNDGKKVVYSNDDVAQNAIKNDFSSEVSSGKETDWDWYYDTDYLFNPSESTKNDANRLWNMATFVTYSTKNGANNISLPAINFTLYSKVDFGVTAAIDTSAGAGLTDIKLNGVSCGGYQYRLISVAKENGKYYATVYQVNETPVLAKVELTDAMAKGQEPLTLTVETNGSAYAWIKISELHMTTKIFDYKAAMAEALAKLPANVEDLTGSEEEGEAALEYMAAAKCMTSAESELYPTPAVVKVGLEAAYVNAIVNAQAGSGAQLAAVEEYRAYIATLTDEEKENSVHKANVEKVHGILKQTVNSEKSLIPNGWWASDEHLGGFKTTYSSTAQKTFDSGSYDGTAVFPAFNFNECQEVYFGLYAVAAAESWDPYNGVIGTITVNGVSFVGIDPQTGDRYFKVTIANGVLTMVNEKDNSVALTVALSEAVLNGTEGLTIDFNFGFWAKAEVTEMHLKTIEPLSIVDLISNEATVAINGTTAGQPNVYFPRNNWAPDGTHVAMQSLTYDYLNFAQYNAANTAYTVTYTLPKVDFSQCSEVYFGIAAATAAGDCTINVGGASYSYDLNAGYLQMKVVIKGNVLTIIGDGANNVGQILASVELSEAILTGEEALTITWTTAGWSQVEITEMRASVEVKPIS